MGGDGKSVSHAERGITCFGVVLTTVLEDLAMLKLEEVQKVSTL